MLLRSQPPPSIHCQFFVVDGDIAWSAVVVHEYFYLAHLKGRAYEFVNISGD